MFKVIFSPDDPEAAVEEASEEASVCAGAVVVVSVCGVPELHPDKASAAAEPTASHLVAKRFFIMNSSCELFFVLCFDGFIIVEKL